jgi:hypothetical protein
VVIRPPALTNGVITLIAGFAGPGCPEATGGTTGPKPVAKMLIVSPGKTGFEVDIVVPFFITAKIPGS